MSDSESLGDTGLPSDVSADEEKQRIDQLSEQHEHGAGETEPTTGDPATSDPEDES